MNKTGEILFHRNMRTDFDQFKKKMQSFLPNLVVGVESTYMFYWLADACKEENIPFYLGYAYYMKTIHGGKTQTGRIDCRKIADIIIHASHKSQLIGDFYNILQPKAEKRKAKSIISHKFGMAIYYVLKNKQVFDEKRFVQTSIK